MKKEDLNYEFMLYGTIFALCNRIQTVGDGTFEDITMKQHFLMVSLQLFEDEFPTLKEVGDLIGCSYQNIKRMALQLEEKGYLRIIEDSKDKRKIRLVMTNKFKELDAEKNNTAELFMKQLYNGISESDIKTTLVTLERMAKNVK